VEAAEVVSRVKCCPFCTGRGRARPHVVFGNRREPESAVVDFDACRTLLGALPTKTIDYRLVSNRGRQDAQSESTAFTARDGFVVGETERTPDLVVVAWRLAGTASRPTPAEPGA
jgi:hypothetical protein